MLLQLPLPCSEIVEGGHGREPYAYARPASEAYSPASAAQLNANVKLDKPLRVNFGTEKNRRLKAVGVNS
jgi:hypothetical protein